ncbi:hypothetical protein P4O66_003885 [Electrophorus voltai]|uniref:Uncharacterized protein n=1 Tax=Electrophorus voltai TaxID=2609070 RepID=A0AAD8ZTJ1_9TELE|nr:hypothetical protein P4O66_003885 [Electrophorus voltai]
MSYFSGNHKFACPQGKPPMSLGTLLMPTRGEHGPGAEAEDWYNDFQSSELDSVDFNYPTKWPSLILASLQGSSTGRNPLDDFGGPCIWSGVRRS